MKKILLLLTLLILLTGCTKVNNDNIDQIIKEVQNNSHKSKNTYRSGYKYYLPSNMNVVKSTFMNEIITQNKIDYYMYVDLVSYYNKVENKYTKKENAYLSKDISTKENIGYLEINQKNNKYLIEIMYNYAKIEVIVEEEQISDAITNSLIILSSIKYNKYIIDNILGEDILTGNEETFNIFETNKTNYNFIEVIEEYDKYDESKLPDYDLVN